MPSRAQKERPQTLKVRLTTAGERAPSLTARLHAHAMHKSSCSEHVIALVHGAGGQPRWLGVLGCAQQAGTTSPWARWHAAGRFVITLLHRDRAAVGGLWRGAAARLGDHQDGGPATCGAVAARQVCWPGLPWPWMAVAQRRRTLGERARR